MEGCQCGLGAVCVGGNCSCTGGLILHSNGRDCRNATCVDSDCLVCSAADVCIRCVKFILSNDRTCVDRCNGEAEVRTDGSLQGNVCIPNENDSIDNKLLIGIVSGVGAGVVLCLLAIVIVCIYIRRTRKNVSLQSQHYKPADLGMGNIKQFPSYDNQGFEDDTGGGKKTGVVDPEVYALQLEQLQPHKETLMTILGQVRPKLRAMNPDDPRIPTYKGVVHQLCRVLVLLHRKDAGPSIPSDALGLIEWAHQMLEDHRQQQQESQDVTSPDVLGDLAHTRISYIDVDMDTEKLRSSAVYAEPTGTNSQASLPYSLVNPYSCVPVPVSPQDPTFPKTFATIHRSPSVPGTVNNNSRGVYTRPSVTLRNNDSNNSKNKSSGYFANGRYYDPNPMPQTEIYAPASSYSDRSTAPLSTFLPDRPRSRSLSSSDPSSEGEMVDGEEGSEGDGELFPFDPKDATEPVEV